MSPAPKHKLAQLIASVALALALFALAVLAPTATVTAAPDPIPNTTQPVATAPPALTVTVLDVDVSAYPRASAVVQIGGDLLLQGAELTTGSLSVLADDAPVGDITIQPTGKEPLPSATILLIDESGSMKGGAISSAAAVARRFVDAMRPVDSIAIQAFNETFRVLHGFSSSKSDLTAALRELAPVKETALYDALLRSVAALEGLGGVRSRYIVLLSDGGDTASKATLEEAVARARASSIQIYTVGLKTTEFDATPLARFAEVSGGRYLETPDPTALSSLYESLAREIHNQYVLSFALPEASRGKGAGRLLVKVNIPPATAQGGRGFFYPQAPPATAPPRSAPAQSPTQSSPTGSPGILASFIGWSGSNYTVALLTAVLLFVALYALSRALLPKRNVLAEYSDILENRRRLIPRAMEEGKKKPRLGERVAGRLLAIRGYQDPLQRRIEDAGWRLRTSEFVLLHLAAIIVVALVLVPARLPLLLSLVIVVIVALGPLVYLNSKARRRRDAFEAQVADTLVLMASSLRAGQGFEQALQAVADEGPEPTAHEFRRLLAQQRLGVSPEETLRTLADRMGSEAFDWVVLVTNIQRQVGGNLAEIYENIANTLRERDTLRREVRTLTAEGRLSALILVLLPFVVGGATLLINPPYVRLLYTTTGGLVMMAGAGVAMLIGILWIRRIVRFDV